MPRNTALMPQPCRLPADGLEVFAVRVTRGFSWEIQRFGGLVVIKGSETYPDGQQASAAGRVVLDRYRGDAATEAARPT